MNHMSKVLGKMNASRQGNGHGKSPCHKGQLHGVYSAPIDKLGSYGRCIRHKLFDAILVGTPVLVAIQKYRTPSRDKLMRWLSFLGTEDFYTPLILLLTWIFDARLGRLVAILMAMGFYVASVGKNALGLPRPPTPPVHVMEKAADWALPSLHSVLGVVLPWYIWIYVYIHYHLSTFMLLSFFCVIAAWSFSVMLSRLYLGVHSPADIVSGGMLGVALLSLFVQIDDFLDHFFGHGSSAILQTFVYIMILLAIHPRAQPETMSYGDTCSTTGVAFGVIVARIRTAGHHHHVAYAALLETVNDNVDSLNVCCLAVGRLIVGIPVIICVRLLVKYIVKTTLTGTCHLINCPSYSYSDQAKKGNQLCKHYTIDFKLPPVHSISKPENEESDDSDSDEEDMPKQPVSFEPRPFNVDIPVKFLTYTAMSWIAVEYCHYIFHYLNFIL